ncbi:barstar family protein [Chromobacterium vaccinii]|uniref:barstar family protein n=1 Tax=Chromobacterium vaccinii TaxID=1108595 RepID=UPI000E1477C3|nr:barstar family protein [Chromobacterium vaccinii]SUX53810.1 Ribonuclease inhibitor [Chromobacterium vaccinii]
MSINEIFVDGEGIKTESDFHRIISEKLEMGPYYGANLDALWDRLSNDVERPVSLVWVNSEQSRQYLGEGFDKIVGVLERVKKQDIDFNFEERFEYFLR